MSVGKGRISALAVGRKKANQEGTDGSTITLLKQYSVAVDPASIAANSGAETSVTVTGVSTDDIILSCEPQAALNAGISFSARVSAANTVAIHFTNATIAAVDVASTTFKITCARITEANR